VACKTVLHLRRPQAKMWLTAFKEHVHGGQGRNEGGTIPRAPNYYVGVAKSQQFHKYFLQYSTFASEKPQVWTWGAKLASCPGRRLTSLRPCKQRLFWSNLTERLKHDISSGEPNTKKASLFVRSTLCSGFQSSSVQGESNQRRSQEF